MNRNSELELQTGSWLEQELGTQNRNSERELEQEHGMGTQNGNQSRLWPHCVAQVLKDSAFAVVHNAFFFFSAEKVKQAKLP